MAIYTRLNKTKISKLLSEFNNLPTGKFTFQGIGMGTVNTYYKITYTQNIQEKIQKKQKNIKKIYFLKIDEVGDETRLENEIRIFQNLITQRKRLGFDFPEPLPTKSKKYYLSFENKFALVLTQLPGKALFDKLTKKHLFKIGESMAKLHQIRCSNQIKNHRFCLAGLQKAHTQISKKLAKQHPGLDVFIRHKLKKFKSAYPKKLKSCLIHADLFPENIHWKKNHLVGILDYEAAGRGEALFDIGVGIHALCLTQKKLDKEKISALLDGYTNIRPLTKIEKKSLSFFLELTALRFLITRLKDFELVGADPNAENFKDYREYVARFEELDVYQNLTEC